MIVTEHCDHGNPPDGSCSVCMERSKAVIAGVIALFDKHGIPQERRWTMLLGHAVGGLIGAGIALDEIRAETERIYHVVGKMVEGKTQQKGLLHEHPDKRVHFEDPRDEAAEGAVCGVSLEASGHPTQFSAGPRSTYHPELVTCPACRLRMGAGQQKGHEG